MTSPQHYDTDVLIVGTGPTGSIAALALATYGVRVHMVSMFNWLANSPRAHITNQRAMEVFRALGIEDDIKRNATPWDQMGDTLFTTSLAGEEIARLRTWGTGDLRKGDYLKGSPCPLVDIIQPEMEPLVLKHAAARGAKVSFNTEYLRHEQDADGVTVYLKDRIRNEEYSLRAKYLVGADGANSKIADEIGLNIEGHMARAGTVYVQFKGDLSRYMAHRPSILNWIVTPEASFGEIGMGVLRAITPWNYWIAGWGFDISKGEADTSEETVRAQIRALVGDDSFVPEIEKVSIWYVNQAYATEYSRGRVFCGGDAVHRHPPSSGLGSNTCVQDAFNLAWKLAFVLKGHAGPALLESYSDERQPVGKQIVLRANQSRLDYKPLGDCFGFKEGVETIDQLLERFRDPSPDGARLREDLLEALELKNYEFNAQGTELNQRYTSSAVLSEPGEEEWKADPQLYLQATTRPGAKLPHAWLINRSGHKVSTLDVLAEGKMTLITGLSGTAWKNAVQELDAPYLACVVTGEPDTQDLYCDWQRIREVHEAGAVLVRPDGYVAWRCQEPVWDSASALATLKEVLSTLLG
ncbi:MAG TPA: FAD-dependent monooxygenase [Marinobacter sp.]|nr:FAD-dependent monooxygenase [Marinobacter sp.]